jgi:hypothetical protein
MLLAVYVSSLSSSYATVMQHTGWKGKPLESNCCVLELAQLENA